MASQQTTADFDLDQDVVWFDEMEQCHRAIVTGFENVTAVILKDLRDGETYVVPVAIVYYF